MKHVVTLASLAITINTLSAGEAPSYAKQVRPIFAKYCLECHNIKSAKGGLILETPKTILEGSDNGPVLKIGKAEESVLIQSIEGKARSLMPPKAKTLRPTKEEIATLRAWINAGATDDSAAIKVVIPNIKPKKATMPPILALTYALQGQMTWGARNDQLVALDTSGPRAREPECSVVQRLKQPITALAIDSNRELLAVAAGKSAASGAFALQPVLDAALPFRFAPAHTDLILDLAFSPDGKTLATCSYDTQVKLWDVATGKLLHTLKDHSDSVYGVAFHPQGKILATCAADRTVKLWDVATAKLLFTFSESTDWNYAVAWRPDGKQLAAAGVDKSIRVWDVNDQGGKVVHAVFAHEGPVTKLIYNQAGDTLYSLGQDRVVKAWDAERMIERKVYEKQPETVLCMALRHDGKQLALGRYDGKVVFLDTMTGQAKVAAAPVEQPAVVQASLQQPASKPEEKKMPPDPFPVVQVKDGIGSPGQGQAIPLPVSLHGKLEKAGDIDFFRFEVKKGQQLGVQAVTAAVGSKVEPALQLVDLRGRVLAESNDGLLGHTFAEAGTFALGIRDREFRGGKDMHYRLHVGPMPIVTAVHPLGIRRGTEAEVSMHGVFLADKSVKVKVPADAIPGSKIVVPITSSLGKPLGNASVVVGEFVEVPASQLALNGMIPVPGTGNGVLQTPKHADTWTFRAQKGQRLILETHAQRLGSRLDSVLEILNAAGKPVPRAVLRCQAKTFVTFRDHDNVGAGIRIDAWSDLAINDLIYVGNELIKIKALPTHPDADCTFFADAAGPRLAYLDTTPTHHSQNLPMYKVSIHPPGTKFPPNGFPVFTLTYRNDDGGPGYGRDSRIFFDPPADGYYQVCISDARGEGGVNYGYRLTVRPPRPSFNVRFSPTNPTVWMDGAVPLTISVDRIDGYDGPIKLRFTNVQQGFSVPDTEMQAGETVTAVALYANPQAPTKPQALTLVGEALIDGQKQVKEFIGEAPKAAPTGEIVAFTDESAVTLRPGGEVKVQVHIERRNGFAGRVPLEVKGLPHGVRVLDIGLNGILVTEKETRRTIVLYAEPWVTATEHPIVILAKREGKNSEHAAKSVLLKVMPK